MLTLFLTGVMLYRALPAPFVWGELGKSIPQVWIIPFRGDVFVGLTALIIAYLLWKRRGLMPWTIGIVFHVIGMTDFLVAAQLFFLAPMPMVPNLDFMIVAISVQLLCIALLVRNRDYYLGPDKWKP
jgi:hypothetical protein